MSQTSEFLFSLYEYLNNKHQLYFWVNPGHKTYQFTIDNIINGVVTNTVNGLIANHDVYFGVGATNKTLDSYERPKNNDISAIPGLWVDIDVFHPVAHKTKELPPDIPAALSLLPSELPPSIIVWSGYGLHVYWLFKEPWELESPDERKHATQLLQSLQAVVRQNAARQGWKIDTTSDLARVLRVPGTINHKLPDSQVQAQVIEQSEIRYNPTDIEDLLPAVESSTQNTNRTAAFERRPTDGPAELMLRSCRFLQHCQINAATINYAEWLAALTNIVRGTDGIQAAHDVSAMDPKRYKTEDTDKKINEALNMNPQTCEYIRGAIGFQGCPPDGCGVQAPCGWSLAKIAKARAIVRGIPAPSRETVLVPEVLGALAVLKQDDLMEFSMFKEACRGRVNLNDLEKLVKQHQRQNTGLRLVKPGEDSGTGMLRDTVSDVPVDLILPPNFRFEKSGILFIKENINGDLMTYKAAGAPVIISERLFNVDSRLEKLEICFQYLNGWRRALFPRSTILDSRRIIQLADYGVSVSSESSKYLVKWFDALSDANKDLIPVTQAVSKLGWRSDREFVLPNLSNQYRIDIDDDGSQQAISGFATTGNRDEWISSMQYLRQSPKARFILSASFAAPLLRILGQRNSVIHNWGASRGGKTATMWAAMSVWGNPNRLIGTFDTTPTAMERKAALHSDLPLAINEREVLNQFRKKDINPLLYVLGEGRGRGRGTKTGLQQMATWRTIVLSTGEGTLSNDNSLEGVMTRVLEICGGPLSHDENFAKNLYNFLQNNHGNAGPEFLHSLLEVDHSIIYAAYQQFQASFCSNFPEKISSHIDAVACVATADYLASAWIFGESWEQAQAGAIAAAAHVLAGLVTRIEASESERAWETFIDWLAENEDRFTILTGPRFGYRVGMDLYIIRDVLKKFLTERFSSSSKIINEWGADGKIATFYEGGRKRFDTRHRRIDGIQPRVIKLSKGS